MALCLSVDIFHCGQCPFAKDIASANVVNSKKCGKMGKVLPYTPTPQLIGRTTVVVAVLKTPFPDWCPIMPNIAEVEFTTIIDLVKVKSLLREISKNEIRIRCTNQTYEALFDKPVSKSILHRALKSLRATNVRYTNES